MVVKQSQFLSLDTDSLDEVVARVVECLKTGGVVAIPTDTIYGIACLAQHVDGVHSVYRIKGREEGKPLAICVGSVDQIEQWCEVPEPALISALLPGPVTPVLTRRPCLNTHLNPSFSTIGIRVPDHPLVLRVCQELGQPLALTSANKSNEASSVCVQQFSALWPSLPLIVDGGTLQHSVGSTVVDLSRPGTYSVIRQGSGYEDTVKTLQQFQLKEDDR